MEKEITHTLKQIVKLLQEIQQQESNYLSFNQAKEFLQTSSSTLYKLTSAKEIKHYKPNGKLLFKKTDLEDWLNQYSVETLEKSREEMNEFLNRDNNNF